MQVSDIGDEDKKRIVQRRILSEEVKHFNSCLYNASGNNPEVYRLAMNAAYENVFNARKSLDLLSVNELRRFSLVLYYSSCEITNAFIDNQIRFGSNDFLTIYEITQIIEKSAKQAQLLYAKESEKDHRPDIKSIIKQYNRTLKFTYSPVQTHFSAASSFDKNTKLTKSISEYISAYVNFTNELKNVGIQEKDLKYVILKLNNSFYQTSIVSPYFEPITLLKKRFDTQYLGADFFKINTLKLEESIKFLKKQNSLNYGDINSILDDAGVVVRDSVHEKTGMFPEETGGFYNNFLLNLYNQDETYYNDPSLNF